MDLRLPIISYAMFPEHAQPVKKVKIQPSIKFTAKTPNTVRNDTVNVLNLKYKMYIEHAAQLTDEEENVAADSDEIIATPLQLKNFPDALSRWGLLLAYVPQSKSEKIHTKSMKRARQNKRVAQDYQIAENAQSNLEEMLEDLEKEDKQRKERKERDAFNLYLWAMKRAQFKKYCAEIKKNNEEQELRERAEKYLEENKNADIKEKNFVRAINDKKRKEETKRLYAILMEDLQDLYDLSHGNLREVMKYVNALSK